MWTFRGQERPPFAVAAGPDQESVWDYPRPPVQRPDARHVIVKLGDVIIADTREAVRILETASPPTFYLPPRAVRTEHLRAAKGTSHCEWKGVARYWDVVAAGQIVERAAWSYSSPASPFEDLADFFAFYPAKLLCTVDGDEVRPQPGGFYGGWVTSELMGPFKGDHGTHGW